MFGSKSWLHIFILVFSSVRMWPSGQKMSVSSTWGHMLPRPFPGLKVTLFTTSNDVSSSLCRLSPGVWSMVIDLHPELEDGKSTSTWWPLHGYYLVTTSISLKENHRCFRWGDRGNRGNRYCPGFSIFKLYPHRKWYPILPVSGSIGLKHGLWAEQPLNSEVHQL